MSKISFNNRNSPFFKVLKEKVDSYFVNNNIHTAGNRRLLFKSLLQISSAMALYIVLVFFNPGSLVSLLLSSLLGFNLAVIGFNVMHEGGHQSFSKHRWLNQASAYSLNILGGNVYFWKIKHNINHHTYTNIEGLDMDIDVQPFMRLHEQQPRYWFHRFQHVYWLVLYSFSYLAWIFYDDFEKYFTGKAVAIAEKRNLAPKEHLIFWLTKIGYVSLFIVIPIVMVGLVKALIGFSIITFVCGLFISIVFQLAHVVESTQFPSPSEESNKMETEWAIHQINTTANFATKNKFISWLLGGLNFQVEHHLFPKISHVHYPQISKLVKETCQEFNITYLEYPSLIKAFYSHLLHIKKLGHA
ncbi:MAG: acyl-CoA desaturase [Bacteroidota bacterium]